jgi:hypothetical protein
MACAYGSAEALDWLTVIEEDSGPEEAEKAVKAFYLARFGEEPPGGFVRQPRTPLPPVSVPVDVKRSSRWTQWKREVA